MHTKRRPAWSPAAIFARPAADKIWTGPAQRSALQYLLGPDKDKVLLGPQSSGKSTLLRHVVARLGETVVLQCAGAKSDPAGLLSSLLMSAELAPWELSEIEQRNLLTVFVQQRRAQGKKVMLLFDDIHRYEPAARDELDRLRELHAHDRLGHTLIAAGESPRPPRAIERTEPSLGASHWLPSPTPEDILEYLRWRLGEHEISVTATAGHLLHRLTAGRYAAIDLLFQMTLLLLKERSRRRVDAQLVEIASANLAKRRRLSAARAPFPKQTDAAQAAPPPAHLLVTRDGKLLARYSLSAKVLIGRSEHNDIWLANPHLSRHHAAIFGTPNGYVVADLHSANGVSLNGKHVTYAPLRNEDVLGMGPFRLKVYVQEAFVDGDPLLEDRTLPDTAIMVSPISEPRVVRRVK